MTRTMAIAGKTTPRCTYAMLIITLLLTAFIFSSDLSAKAAIWGGGSGTPQSFSELAQKVSPAVVNIRTVKIMKGGGKVFRHFSPGPWGGEDDPRKDFFDRFFGPEQQREFKQRSLGSGFIISSDGYIVTNNHVVEDADEIRVILKDGKEFDATIEGRDPNTDLALIKVKSDKPLPSITLGNSESLNVGEWVVAIGSPFGLEQTVTAGIISAKGRVIGSGPYDDFLQTDASINPGNSGGPLLNMEGEVIGINTAIIAGGSGIGFAIPINLAKGIIDQLKSHGEVVRGWLGVQIQDLSKEMSEYHGTKDKKGALVLEVIEGNPAAKAGIKAKDIITEVNGKPIESVRDLTRIIADIPVGDTALVTVIRNGKQEKIKVNVAKREAKEVASKMTKEKPDEDLGIRVTDITPEMAQQYELPEKTGVIVTNLAPDGKAAEAGLQMGDVIKEINHQEINSLNDYRKAMAAAESAKEISMFIRRQRAGFLVIKITR
jgi:serine protease Do